MPGVQKPHWMAPWSTNACCSAESVPGSPFSASAVSMTAPSASTANTRQEFTGLPFRITVHSPHSPM